MKILDRQISDLRKRRDNFDLAISVSRINQDETTMRLEIRKDYQLIPEVPFAFEKEKLDKLDQELGPVMQLSLEELRSEALEYLGDREYKVWTSIPTNKGELRDPRIDKVGRATASSDHTEVEVLQAIVHIERWKAARRSAGSRKAAITRKNNKHALEYFSEKLAEAKLLSEDGSTIELDNLRAVIECADRGPI
jgi:hypothetical protein